MEENQPSRTAQGAAMLRAAHQLLDNPPVFADPLALRIIGNEAETELRNQKDALQADRPRTGLRAFIAARSRFSEDTLAEAVGRGVRRSCATVSSVKFSADCSSTGWPRSDP